MELRCNQWKGMRRAVKLIQLLDTYVQSSERILDNYENNKTLLMPKAEIQKMLDHHLKRRNRAISWYEHLYPQL